MEISRPLVQLALRTHVSLIMTCVERKIQEKKHQRGSMEAAFEEVKTNLICERTDETRVRSYTIVAARKAAQLLSEELSYPCPLELEHLRPNVVAHRLEFHLHLDGG